MICGSYPTIQLPRTLLPCLDLEFSVDSLPVLSVVGGPAKPVRFSATEANLHRLTLCHQCNGSMSLGLGKKTLTHPDHSMACGGAV